MTTIAIAAAVFAALAFLAVVALQWRAKRHRLARMEQQLLRDDAAWDRLMAAVNPPGGAA